MHRPPEPGFLQALQLAERCSQTVGGRDAVAAAPARAWSFWAGRIPLAVHRRSARARLVVLSVGHLLRRRARRHRWRAGGVAAVALRRMAPRYRTRKHVLPPCPRTTPAGSTPCRVRRTGPANRRTARPRALAASGTRGLGRDSGSVSLQGPVGRGPLRRGLVAGAEECAPGDGLETAATSPAPPSPPTAPSPRLPWPRRACSSRG